MTSRVFIANDIMQVPLDSTKILLDLCKFEEVRYMTTSPGPSISSFMTLLKICFCFKCHFYVIFHSLKKLSLHDPGCAVMTN